MAVPTITNISPATGPTGGRNLIIITGTNFKLPPVPAALGPVAGTGVPTVRVTIGGESAIDVDVTGADQLRVLAPGFRGADTQVNPIVAVAIVVTNLDALGVPIPGETVTANSAYIYVRPALRAPAATYDNQRYGNIVRNVLRVFRRQVHPNTELANTSVDFGDVAVEIIHDVKMPNVVIDGPTLLSDNVRSTNESRSTYNSSAGRYDRFIAPVTRMLGFEVRCTVDNKLEGIAFQQSIEELFRRNGYLYVDIVPSTPSSGRERFPFCLTQKPAFSPGSGAPDIHIVKAAFEIRGVDLELPEAFESVEGVTGVGTIDIQVQQTDDSPGTETGTT